MIPCLAQTDVATAAGAAHSLGMAATYWSTRRDLSDAPVAVRTWLADALGDEPVSWTTAVGGFSPGIAARLVTADGRRAFVKAVDGSANRDTPQLFRDEAAALRILGADPATRRLIAPMLDSYDDGDWVALLLTDIDGATPAQPFVAADVEVVGAGLTALADSLGRITTDVELPTMASSSLAEGWGVLAEAPELLDAWTRRHLSVLLELADHSRSALRGRSLLHFDIRSDNILLTGAGVDRRAVFVDWAWLRYGAGWLDAFLFGFDLATAGGEVDAQSYVANSPVLAEIAARDITSALAAVTGVMLLGSRKPPPPGLPGISDWQAHLATGGLRWLQERLTAGQL
jgi:hypothetical protein